jgi:hypothetical protein
MEDLTREAFLKRLGISVGALAAGAPHFTSACDSSRGLPPTQPDEPDPTNPTQPPRS